MFDKGQKAKWSLDKILSELQVPKEQKELISESGLSSREEIMDYLRNNFNFGVEVNLAKQGHTDVLRSKEVEQGISRYGLSLHSFIDADINYWFVIFY